MILEHLTEQLPGVRLELRLQFGVLQATRLAAFQPGQHVLEPLTRGGEYLHRCRLDRLDRLDRLGHDRLARRAATRASRAVSPAAACSSCERSGNSPGAVIK